MPTVYEAKPDGWEESHLLIGTPKGAKEERRRRIRYEGPEALMQRMLAFMEDDEYLSLVQEIALARSILGEALVALKEWQETIQEKVGEGQLNDLPKPPVSLSQLMSTISTISKLVQREHDMRYNDANLITTDSAVAFALAMASLVNQFVKGEDEREAVIEGTRRLLAAGRTFDLDIKVVKKIFGVKEGEDNGIN